MKLRRYMYLDTETVQDYASNFSTGVIEQLTETSRSGAGKAVGQEDDKSTSEEEVTRESIMKLTTKHLFSQIYEQLGDTIRVYDEDQKLALDDVRRSEVVEVTRTFYPSAVNEMLESILDLLAKMQQLGFTEELAAPEVQQGVRAMAMIFQGDEGEEEIPMVSAGEGDDTSLVFLAKTRYILGNPQDFQGDMTVFGTVKKKVPKGQAIDLFDYLKLPRALRGQVDMKEELYRLFQTWPKELGGPIDRKNTVVPGPAVIVTPVAVYDA